MPNRYEREIEEILRNLEQQEPKSKSGQKSGERFRRKPDDRTNTRPRRSFAFNFGRQEWFLIVAVGAALIAGGYAYIVGPNIITGLLALVATVCLVLLILSAFLFQARPSSTSRYSNVTPLRRPGPLNSLRTRWNLILLKLRYRRKKS